MGVKIQIVDDGKFPADKRGRKMSPLTRDLADAFGKVPAGKAVAIPDLAVPGDDDEAAKARAKNGAIIRAAAKSANLKAAIRWSEGVPYVRLTKV